MAGHLPDATLHEALLRRLRREISGGGNLVLPAVPALADTYVDLLTEQFLLARGLSDDERAELRATLEARLDEAWRISADSMIRVEWTKAWEKAEPVSYSISVDAVTPEAAYEVWTKEREPPLFGAYPDAKVVDVAASLGAAAETPCLDVGAGTGRNTLPLARLGHPVTAVEPAPALFDVLRGSVEAEGLSVDLFQGGILDPGLVRPDRTFRFAFLSQVLIHFRRLSDVRAVFERLAELVVPDGVLLVSVFLTREGFVPDDLVRQYAGWTWTGFHTREELDGAIAGLPFVPVSVEPVHDYEKAHLPEDAWPPVTWFPAWARGQEVFDLPPDQIPIELMWMAYRRTPD